MIFCILSFNKYFLLTFKLNDIKENHNVVAKERYKDIINLNGNSNPTIIPENMETKNGEIKRANHFFGTSRKI